MKAIDSLKTDPSCNRVHIRTHFETAKSEEKTLLFRHAFGDWKYFCCNQYSMSMQLITMSLLFVTHLKMTRKKDWSVHTVSIIND